MSRASADPLASCLYARLGITKVATREEVARAYRRLALRLHPDKAQDQETAADLFSRAHEAYAVLSDPKAREQYDQTGSTGTTDGGLRRAQEHPRSVRVALILLFVPPLQLMGLFSIYVKRWSFACLYISTTAVAIKATPYAWCTICLLVLADLVRCKSLVQQANIAMGFAPPETSTPETSEPADSTTTGHPLEGTTRKSLFDAYLHWLPPGGWLGAHHMFLRSRDNVLGLAYLFSGGLLGIGWIVDFFLLPWWHARSEEARKRSASCSLAEALFRRFDAFLDKARGLGDPLSSEPGCVLNPYRDSSGCDVVDAYLLATPMGGLIGLHHLYLGRPKYALYCALTLNYFPFGYLYDLMRMKDLVAAANVAAAQGDSHHCSQWDTGEAWVTWLPPWGLLGWHNIFLRRYWWALAQCTSFGLLGIGWVLDGIHMKERLEGKRQQSRTNDTTNVWPNVWLAYALWCPFGGLLGLHHYYLGYHCQGLKRTLTLNYLCVGWLMDAFQLPRMIRQAADNTSQGNDGFVGRENVDATMRRHAVNDPTPTSQSASSEGHVPSPTVNSCGIVDDGDLDVAPVDDIVEETVPLL